MSTPDWIQIDGESDMIRHQQELNHSSVLEEIRRITDCECVGVLKRCEVLIYPSVFRSAEICDRTRSRILLIEIRFLEPNNPNRAAVNLFAGSNVVESAAKWIVPDDADVEVVDIGFSAGRNAHELAEVEQVCGLYRVL